jgi:rubredoxin
MKTTSPTLRMTLDVECPECGHEYDLFKNSANIDNDLYSQLLTDDRWLIPAEDRLKADVECPKCKAEFEVKGVIW